MSVQFLKFIVAGLVIFIFIVFVFRTGKFRKWTIAGFFFVLSTRSFLVRGLISVMWVVASADWGMVYCAGNENLNEQWAAYLANFDYDEIKPIEVKYDPVPESDHTLTPEARAEENKKRLNEAAKKILEKSQNELAHFIANKRNFGK